MNVLLVITNISGYHEVPYSHGLSSICAYLKKLNFNSKILSICKEEDYFNLQEQIKLYKPDVVGFTSVSSQFSCVIKSAGLIKNIDKNIFIVCGGIHPTLFPDALLETGSIDGFFIGESEIAFGDLLDKLRRNEEYKDTNNFAYKLAGRIIVNQLNPLIEDIDDLPFPDKDTIFNEYINQNNGIAPFFFSRGCPYSCSYCSNQAIAKIYGISSNKPRYRSVDSCIEEIKDAKNKYRFDSIYIQDDTFGINKTWRKAFCKKYKKDINIPFICLLRVNIVDEEFINTLKGAGCYRILFGVESGNDYVRNTIMNRNISKEQIISAFNLCRKYEIESCAINIIGVPGETEEMLLDTIRLNRKLNPTDSGVNIFYPYKGTPLGDHCFANGLVDEKMYYNFTNERRETVLKFENSFKNKLRYYYKYWDLYVYPLDFRKCAFALLKSNQIIYNNLRKMKQIIMSIKFTRRLLTITYHKLN